VKAKWLGKGPRMMDDKNSKVTKTIILVVEDDPVMNDAVRDVFEGAGYGVLSAFDGQTGLELFKKHQPNLILSCVDLPVLDGYGLLDEVRKRPAGQVTPFVFLTAHGDHEEVRKGMDRGVEDYLTKPIKGEELIAVVEARIKRMDGHFPGQR
jgi:DNA-binding response OmpR family regulator